jgi:hypothetical protein
MGQPKWCFGMVSFPLGLNWHREHQWMGFDAEY